MGPCKLQRAGPQRVLPGGPAGGALSGRADSTELHGFAVAPRQGAFRGEAGSGGGAQEGGNVRKSVSCEFERLGMARESLRALLVGVRQIENFT